MAREINLQRTPMSQIKKGIEVQLSESARKTFKIKAVEKDRPYHTLLENILERIATDQQLLKDILKRIK